MASKNQEKGALVSHPLYPSTTPTSGVVTLALTAAAVSFAVPEDLRGKFVRFRIQGMGTGKYQYNFTNVPATLVYNQVSTFTPADINIGWTVVDNEVIDARIPQVATYLNGVGSPGMTGILEISTSETPN